MPTSTHMRSPNTSVLWDSSVSDMGAAGGARDARATPPWMELVASRELADLLVFLERN
jgi:hypothetical protein